MYTRLLLEAMLKVAIAVQRWKTESLLKSSIKVESWTLQSQSKISPVNFEKRMWNPFYTPLATVYIAYEATKKASANRWHLKRCRGKMIQGPCYCCTGFCSIFATLAKNEAKSLLLPYMEVKVPTHWGLWLCNMCLLSNYVGSMLQRFCKTLYASISTEHKA